MKIRPAQVNDIEAITGIYNDAVLKTTDTFDTEPRTIEQQTEWFHQHDEKHPVIVAVLDGRVAGWASLTLWSDRPAYSRTAEISVYVQEDFRNMGLGKGLMREITEAGKNAGLHTIIARIAAGNGVSIRLHESFGFEHVGIMREVGRKFGRVIDVYLMQKIYDGSS